MFTIVIIIIIAAVVAIFSLQNATPVSVTFLSLHFEASLAIVILLSVLAGFILGMIVLLTVRIARSSRKKMKQNREHKIKDTTHD